MGLKTSDCRICGHGNGIHAADCPAVETVREARMRASTRIREGGLGYVHQRINDLHIALKSVSGTLVETVNILKSVSDSLSSLEKRVRRLEEKETN